MRQDGLAQEMTEREPRQRPERILIAATPKTGNTWLKLLVSRIYDLPVARLPAPFSPGAWDAAGARWVAHQHVPPTPSLLDWIGENAIAVITVLRHPGDVLVSLFHYARWADTGEEIRALAQDGKIPGPQTIEYVRSLRFARLLSLSAQWRARDAIVVRYEELLEDPVGSLSRLTDEIWPVGRDRIECAAAACEIGQLRGLKGREDRHFRAGLAGQWVDSLPPAHIAALADTPRYRELAAQLGYSFDIGSQRHPEPFDYARISPFVGNDRFDNGVPIPPIVVDLYFSHPGLRARWPNPLRTGDRDSYLAWLSSPTTAPSEGNDIHRGPSPLARHLRDIRPDLREAFPDPDDADRLRFCHWFLVSGQREYRLPPELVQPIQELVRELSAVER